jgi:Icc protein
VSIQFAQISDCHIGPIENNKNLHKTLLKIKELGIKILVVSGDVTEHGLLSEYLQFQNLTQDFKVFVLAGNHDSHVNLHKVFTSWQTTSFTLGGYNIQLINSQVVGEVYGNIDITTIDTHLTNSILITHHPIVNMHSSWDDNLSCKNRDEVLKYISNIANIKAVCFGHTHEAKDFQKNHITIYSCPSTAYSFDNANATGFNLYTLDKDIIKTTIWV